MAYLGEFGAEVAAVDMDAVPDTFSFHGEEFHLPAGISALPILRFAYDAKRLGAEQKEAEAAERKAITPAEREAAAARLGTVEMEGSAALYEYLRGMLPDQWERFSAVAERVGASTDELLALANKLMEAVTARPTRLPSTSPAGPSSPGGGSTAGAASPAPASASTPGLSERELQRAEHLRDMVPVAEAVRSGA